MKKDGIRLNPQRPYRRNDVDILEKLQMLGTKVIVTEHHKLIE